MKVRLVIKDLFTGINESHSLGDDNLVLFIGRGIANLPARQDFFKITGTTHPIYPSVSKCHGLISLFEVSGDNYIRWEDCSTNGTMIRNFINGSDVADREVGTKKGDIERITFGDFLYLASSRGYETAYPLQISLFDERGVEISVPRELLRLK